MKVRRIQSAAEAQSAYPCATESPRPFWAAGLSLSRQWFADQLGRAVEGFHLLDNAGAVIGHLYWAPGQQSLAPYRFQGKVAYEYCEWVQREFQGQGGMRMLFDAFLEHLHSEGYQALLVDGTQIEGYMHADHFRKRGFRPMGEADEAGLLVLPLTSDAIHVEPLETRLPPPRAPVDILVIGSLFCPVGAYTVRALRKLAQQLPPRVRLQEIPASREAIEQYGVADGIFINGQPRFFGPVTESQIRQTLEKELGSAIQH